MRELYSIRDAARAAGLPEERLRRAILTGALVAQPVADDRQYLIRASELRHFAGLPEPEPAADLPCCGRPSFLRMAVALTFIVGAVLLILQLSPRSVPAVCLDCGSVKEVFGSRTTPCGSLPMTNIRRTHLTELIEQAYPGKCGHDWLVAPPARCGGSRRALSTVAVIDRAGIFTRAAEVDSEGAADLVRWALRNPLTPERLRLLTDTAFETAGDFRAWFANLRGDAAAPKESF